MVIRMGKAVRTEAGQGAEVEGVGPSKLRVNGEVRGLIRLWKSVENSKAEPFTKIVKDAAPRQGSLLHPFKNEIQRVSSLLQITRDAAPRRRSVCYPPTTHCWSSNRNIATKPGDAEECPQENSR